MKINKTAREKERFEGGSGFKATVATKKGGQNRGGRRKLTGRDDTSFNLNETRINGVKSANSIRRAFINTT